MESAALPEQDKLSIELDLTCLGDRANTVASRVAAKFTLEVRFEALPCFIRSV